jgi:hypothetical protein
VNIFIRKIYSCMNFPFDQPGWGEWGRTGLEGQNLFLRKAELKGGPLYLHTRVLGTQVRAPSPVRNQSFMAGII